MGLKKWERGAEPWENLKCSEKKIEILLKSIDELKGEWRFFSLL